MYNKKIFSDRIRNLRKEKWTTENNVHCKSQEALADALFLDRKTIISWENGANIPTLDNLVNLCNLLNCNIDYLLGADYVLNFKKYNLKVLNDRLRKVRKKRWNDYKDNKDNPDNNTKKYECCKTQETMADALNTKRKSINKWENGNSIPSLDNLISFCELLDCNVGYLLGANDLLESSPVSIASLYSGISPEIIRFAKENNDYLDFLNYFMHPDRCKKLFNKFMLSTWKEYTIEQELYALREPLKKDMYDIFEKFSAMTPIEQFNIDKYREFLAYELPENNLALTSKDKNKHYDIKKCLSAEKYNELTSSQDNELSYNKFIKFLADYTYEPLNEKSLLEKQKYHLAKTFLSLVDNYLMDDE